MPFVPSRSRAVGPSGKGGPVLAVGRRVFVHCATDRHGSVALTDEAGRVSRWRLQDGDEVEVLAWRPRGATGTRYRVRAAGDGAADGWLPADSLRTAVARPSPAPAPVAAAPVVHAEPGARRFGQRPGR